MGTRSRQRSSAIGRSRRLHVEGLEPRRLLSRTHWYTFNDGTGADLVGEADLALVNGAGVAVGQLLLANQGVDSGDAANVQYASLPVAALPTGGTITVEAWFRTNNAENWTRVFDFGDQSGSNGDSYLFYTPRSSGGEARAAITAGGAGNERIASGAATDDGGLHLSTVVVDAGAGQILMYLDGSLVDSTPLNGVDLTDVNVATAYLGRSHWNADHGFTGTIDEVSIYDHALSPVEVAANAAQGPVANPDAYPENPVVLPRQVENLNRGVVAMRTGSSSVYVGWRLLGTDPQDIAFNLYRSVNGQAPSRLHIDPITQSTNFVDNSAGGGASYEYFVRPVVGGIEQPASEAYELPAGSPAQQHLDIPLVIPAGGVTPDGVNYTYSANDASVGDLDGDGQYEVILKWDPSNSKDNAHSGYTGNVYVDAYSLEPDQFGNHLLWRIDLGRNIRAGAHYTQMAVYDFDGDGRSEIMMKTAPGTIDGQGSAVLMPGHSANADYRNSSGYILTGPEYLTVFDGLTGAELDTVAFEPERVHVSQWGDGYGNRVDRFTVGVAYLDGQRPSAVYGRGYYGPQGGYQSRNEVAAYDYRDGQLTLRWVFEAATNGANPEYIGQGAHSLTVGDVDGDGFDEIIYGASAIDHDGTGLYSTGLGHGDALHMSDLIPSNPGLEVFMPHEGAASNGNVGVSVRDAQTGELIYTLYGAGDIGRGVAADIDPNHAGYEFWATTSNPGENRKIYNAQGEAIYDAGNVFSNFVIWWDGDLTRELLDGTTIANWNPGRQNIVWYGASGINNNAPGGASVNVASNNGTKQTPALTADILGDWREEVIWRTSDSSALQIWSSAIVTSHRLPTLMHDTQYRVAVAWQNGGYNQPPHPSYWIGEGMDDAPRPPLFYGGELAGDYNLDQVVDAGDYTVWRDAMASQSLTADGDRNGQVDHDDYLVWRNNYGATSLPPQFLTSGGLTVSAARAIADAPADPEPSHAVFAILGSSDASRATDDHEIEETISVLSQDPALLLLLDLDSDASENAVEDAPLLADPVEDAKPDHAILSEDWRIDWEQV